MENIKQIQQSINQSPYVEQQDRQLEQYQQRIQNIPQPISSSSSTISKSQSRLNTLSNQSDLQDLDTYMFNKQNKKSTIKQNNKIQLSAYLKIQNKKQYQKKVNKQGKSKIIKQLSINDIKILKNETQQFFRFLIKNNEEYMTIQSLARSLKILLNLQDAVSNAQKMFNIKKIINKQSNGKLLNYQQQNQIANNKITKSQFLIIYIYIVKNVLLSPEQIHQILQ